MDTVFSSFLTSGYRYEYLNGPDIIQSEAQAKEQGLNCIALMHLLLKRLHPEVTLPSNLRGWEMFCENPYFTDVPSLSVIKKADIFFLGRAELPEYSLAFKPKFDTSGQLTNQQEGDSLIQDQYAGVHLAMYTGENDEQGSPLLIHANKIENTVSLWPLSKFQSLEQYPIIHAIKRLKQ